jgi:hypothetical protein
MNVFVMITSNELHGDERAFLRWNFKGDAYGMIAFMLTLFIKFVLRFIHEIKKNQNHNYIVWNWAMLNHNRIVFIGIKCT